MNEETKGVEVSATTTQANGETTTVKKQNRRGVGSARGTQRLKFNHTDAVSGNALFLGHLDSVVVTDMLIGEETTGMPSFNGMKIPKITFTFTSNESDITKRKFATIAFNAVESNVDTIPGAKASWKVDSVMDWFKHLLNVYYLRGRELTEDEEATLSLPFDDFDENGDYVALEPEVVVAGWRTLFENMENVFNHGRENAPIYKTKDGKDITVWMKLLRFTKVKGEWSPVVKGNNAGDLAFPTFVGEGCIEIWKDKTIPVLHLNSITETILPREINKPKTPNMNPGMPNNSVPMTGGIPSGNMGGGMYGGGADIAMSAAEDLPF